MPDINMSTFEAAQRNQLVTEVDIQTQVALDNYQVQLSDIDNPTQSQDNVVIDRFGEFLPHWNESLDFDTWVKMSMEIAGKRLLMLRGNSSIGSESSGSDTFIQWHGAASASFVDGLVLASGSPFIYENKYRVTTTAHNLKIGVGDTNNWSDEALDLATYNVTNLRYFHTLHNGASAGSLSESPSLTANQWYGGKISFNGTVAYGYVDGNEIGSGGISTNLPDEDMGLFMYVAGGSAEQEWAFVREYISTEPTSTISTPKNISTALKSLGRAG